MGGSALKLETRRIGQTEFNWLSMVIVNALRDELNTRIAAIQSYTSKPDFGDIDILVQRPDVDLSAVIVKLFEPNEIVHNGDIYSFDYLDVQIDLIVVNANEFDFAHKYFNFNDLGNLIGRVAHRAGFKFGHRGLLYCMCNGTHLLKELVVTQDFYRTLEFLGYDASRYSHGFNELTDIFEYVMSSPYYSPDIYQFAHRNHYARTRDRKRKTYNAFLKYIEGREPPGIQQSKDNLRCERLAVALYTFPQFDADLSSTLREHSQDIVYRSKFNGNIVGNLTGLKGRDCGMFIAYLHERFGGPKSLKEFVVRSNQSDIDSMILTYFSEF